MNIKYKNDIKNLTPAQLNGFFVGWPEHPDPETSLKILSNSYAIGLAFDRSQCVGFINALSDGTFYLFPFLKFCLITKGMGLELN